MLVSILARSKQNELNRPILYRIESRTKIIILKSKIDRKLLYLLKIEAKTTFIGPPKLHNVFNKELYFWLDIIYLNPASTKNVLV